MKAPLKRGQSQQQAVRNNVIRIVTVILITLIAHKLMGVSLLFSILIGYVTGLITMLAITKFVDKN